MLNIYLEPVHKFLSYMTSDPEWDKRSRVKGGVSAGSFFFAKWSLYQLQKPELELENIQRQRMGGTTLYDIVSNNILRLSALAGIERVITLQQGYAVNKHRFLVQDGFFGTLRGTFNQGLLSGYFKGYWAFAAHFLGVSYNSFLWLNKASLAPHLLLSTMFETIFYPLDTLKTLMNNDLNGTYKGYADCLSKTLATKGYGGLFQGLAFKLSHNALFVFHLRCLYDNDKYMFISMPLWMLSYILLSLKTVSQMIGSPISQIPLEENPVNFQNHLKKHLNPRALYSGFLGYTLINTIFAYNFYALYSDKAYKKIVNEKEKEIDSKLESKYERFFS